LIGTGSREEEKEREEGAVLVVLSFARTIAYKHTII